MCHEWADHPAEGVERGGGGRGRREEEGENKESGNDTNHRVEFIDRRPKYSDTCVRLSVKTEAYVMQ